MYTPPAGNAVAFNFTASYTPPDGDAVLFNFSDVTVPPASMLFIMT